MSEKNSGFDLETVKKLADIVKSNDLGEITVVDGDKRISVKGKVCLAGSAPAPVTAAPAAPASAPAVSREEKAFGNSVKAPIVGTFYSAPSPDAEPFVTVGKTVKKGDTIFIIESMKVMNEVLSEFDGVVKEIMVSDGDPVDFDQTVMVIG
jgi:acetyl-CoA carboxylase biotin carboxyl carrier protein